MNGQLLCIRSEAARKITMKARFNQSPPEVGRPYTAKRYIMRDGVVYYELYEIPPGQQNFRPVYHFWSEKLFAEPDWNADEIKHILEAAKQRAISREFYAGMRHETDALSYLLGGYGCRHKWDKL